MSIVINTEQYVEKVSAVHKNFYGYAYTKYTRAHDTILVECPHHGVFEIRAYAHRNGQGCKKCHIQSRLQSKPKPLERFISQAHKQHLNFYSYDKVKYVNNLTKVIITCPLHGDFDQRPSQHLVGNGCPDCANARKQYSILPGLFYVLEMKKGKECFWKIGITKNTPKQRYQSKIKSGYYKWTEVIGRNMPLNEAFKIEQNIKQTLKDYRYRPKHKFAGHTECFSSKVSLKTLRLLTFNQTLIQI